MAKYKPYNYDQLVMIPISLENQLEPGTLEYTINELVENNIDLSVFEGRYQNDDTGAIYSLWCTISAKSTRLERRIESFVLHSTAPGNNQTDESDYSLIER